MPVRASLDRSTLADWVGRAAFALRPVYARLFERLKQSTKLFADETTAPVLDPAAGAPRRGSWAYARDDRPFAGPEPPGVAYVYALDRKHAAGRALAGFTGTLQVDGYGAYAELAAGDVALAFCWSHVRRRFYEIQVATPARSPARRSPDRRALCDRSRYPWPCGRRAPTAAAAAREADHRRLAALARRQAGQRLAQIDDRRSDPLRPRAGRLARFLDDGRLEIDSNVVERAMRPIALGRKNHLFAGSDGGEHWAVIASLIETCKMNDVDPEAYLRDVLTKIVARHPMSRIDELLPFGYAQPAVVRAAA